MNVGLSAASAATRPDLVEHRSTYWSDIAGSRGPGDSAKLIRKSKNWWRWPWRLFESGPEVDRLGQCRVGWRRVTTVTYPRNPHHAMIGNASPTAAGGTRLLFTVYRHSSIRSWSGLPGDLPLSPPPPPLAPPSRSATTADCRAIDDGVDCTHPVPAPPRRPAWGERSGGGGRVWRRGPMWLR